MAVVSRISTIVLDIAGSTRTWTATSATQDTAAGSSVVVTLVESSSGATPPVASTNIDLSMRIDNSATEVINFVCTPGAGSQTQTFHFTSTGAAGGANRCGTIRQRLRVRQTAGLAATQYDIQSDDATGQALPTGGSVTTRDRGWIRGTTTATVKVTKTNFTDAAFTGTYSYPDSIFIRTTLAALAYDTAKTITNSVGGVQTSAVNDAVATANDQNYDSTFTNGVTATNYTAAQTSRICTVSTVQNADLGTSVGWVSLTSITTQTLTVDPRLTFTGVTRTSSLAVVNYGLHTVTGTFSVLNARSETLTSATHGAFANMTLKSLDIVGSVAEKTISASITPSSGVYSLSHVFSGPTSTGSRGTGPNGDTAAHTTAGKTKGLQALPVSDAANTFNSTATFVSLSDLLRLDVHPQKTTSLLRDTDPYANPGDGEAPACIIGSDTLRLYAFVGDVAGAALGNISIKLALFDPSDLPSTEGEATRSTTSGGANSGWVTSSASFGVIPPAGNWKARVRVDVTDTGAVGNYGDTSQAAASGINVAGALIQTVGFISAYTADKDLDMQVQSEYGPGDPAYTIYLQYLNNDRTVLALDANPFIRIYKINSDGTLTTEMAATQTTGVGATNVYALPWSPGASIGSYIIEAVGTFTAAGIRKSTHVDIRPRYVFDPTGGLFK